MKQFFKTGSVLMMLMGVPIAHASEVGDVLSKIVTTTYSGNDLLVQARLQNQLIRMGSPAVDELIQALANESLDISGRWAAAQVLGEIGDAKATPTLKTIVDQPTWGAISWLQDTCARSLKLFEHPEKRSGKIYVYSYSNVCERTDPDTGVTQPCP